MKRIIYIVLMIVLFITAGCGGKSEPVLPEIPTEPDISGLIFSISDGRILIVDGIEHVQMPYSEWFEQGYRAIWFSIDNDTEILFSDGSTASFVDLEEGQQVDAWSSGPLMESYPEQGGAIQIVIVKGAPDVKMPENAPADITDAATFYQFIKDNSYTSWDRAPGYETRQPALGPHKSDVDVYINNILADSLDETVTTLPPGSIIVKDAFKGDNLDIIAAMFKLSGGGWYWAEWRGDGTLILSGENHGVCVGCHGEANDGVLAFPLSGSR